MGAVELVLWGLVGAAAGWAARPTLAAEGAGAWLRSAIPEALTATLFVIAAWRVDEWRTIPMVVLALTVSVLTIVDLADYRLPNRILFPGIVASAALIVLGEVVDGDTDRLWAALVGASLYWAVLFVLHVVNPAGMGFGDVKLAVLLGMFVGWVAGTRLDAVRAVMMALLIGSAIGVVLGVGRMAALRMGARFLPDPEEGSAGTGWHRTTFPFGPPLMAAALAVAWWPSTFLG